MDTYEAIILIFKIIIGLTVFFILLFVVIRPLLSSLSEARQGLDQLHDRQPLYRRHRVEDEELEIPTSHRDDMTNEKIIQIAKNDPAKTTVLVRNWIHEKNRK